MVKNWKAGIPKITDTCKDLDEVEEEVEGESLFEEVVGVGLQAGPKGRVRRRG